MQVFIVALIRQFALYRKGCNLTTAIFVGFMFIEINIKSLKCRFTTNQQNFSYSFGDLIVHNYHPIMREINFNSEVNTSDLRSKILGLER